MVSLNLHLIGWPARQPKRIGDVSRFSLSDISSCHPMSSSGRLTSIQGLIYKDHPFLTIFLIVTLSVQRIIALFALETNTMVFQLMKWLFSLNFRRHFRIDRKIGQGGFSKVYAVTRLADSKVLAAKKLDKSKVLHLSDTGSRGPIPVEIDCLNGLRHENIIPIYGYVETRHYWYLMMEYCETSVDLFSFIRTRGALHEKVSRDILLQVHSAVSYCLAAGVDHRDVKDRNILIDVNTLKVKLIDFGLAAPYQDNTPYTDGRGTSGILPPELYKTGSYLPLDGLTWALGCLVYKMVTGRRPFTDRQEAMERKPSSPPTSELCRDFIGQCIAKKPSKRTPFDKLVAHRWCWAVFLYKSS